MAASGSKRPAEEEPAGHRPPPPKKLARGKMPLSTVRRQGSAVRQTLLPLYFGHIQTLRAHLLASLPASSRLRRKKIRSVGLVADATPLEQQLGRLLDSALVAKRDNADASLVSIRLPAEPSAVDDRPSQRLAYTERKRADDSHVTVSGAQEGVFSPQSEIVDFVVWLLFKRAKERGRVPKKAGDASQWATDLPQNVLCHGFQPLKTQDDPGSCHIPGLFCVKPPQNSDVFKKAPWPQILALLGAAGESIMISLLMDCSVFLPVEAGRGNFIQVTGKPLYDLEPVATTATTATTPQPSKDVRPFSEIVFVRSRMFYARPNITEASKVRFGLKHIHVLNRFPYRNEKTKKRGEQDREVYNRNSTVRVMMYIFPRQFGLHNAFTSTVDRSITAQKFQDYTLREDEIATQIGSDKFALPKRLRGMPFHLVEKLRILHNRCSYYELLQHYCPAKTDAAPGQGGLVDLATPLFKVSAFCRAVFFRIVPDDFWGSGETRRHNKQVFLDKIDLFLRLRRFETLNLHDLLQGIQFAHLEWLAPPGLRSGKVSQTDGQKRREIFAEFLYYLVDSFLIPLILTNFYVTESNNHRNKLFFFRHDVWRRVAEPALTDVKARMFEEVKPADALRILGSRKLGHGQIRLLPKQSTVRPIVNLRRRMIGKGSVSLGSSANTILKPVFSMLQLAMRQNPDFLGSGMFSVRSIHPRLKAFKRRMFAEGQRTFYFAKVDVKSAFDTIPQAPVIEMIRRFAAHPAYNMDRHVEITASEKEVHDTANARKLTRAPIRQWRMIASPATGTANFLDAVEGGLGARQRNTIFVDNASRKMHESDELVAQAASHILQNLVKIGKKMYRQKDGIPQGSILSSLLCNCFYAQLEASELSFIGGDGDCLLLRLIDDFMLITSDRDKAARFIEVMHRGLPQYGVAVNPKKSLVNFELCIDGTVVARHPEGRPFPYCGTEIHCTTLDIAKDWESKKQVPFDTLTVEYSRTPGYHFQRKVFSYFKMSSTSMFFDTSHNSLPTTFNNIHKLFEASAVKMWAYARCLPRQKRPSGMLTIRTIQELFELALAIFFSRAQRHANCEFSVHKHQLRWLLLHAFWCVLKKKQASYADVLAWLHGEMKELQSKHPLRLPKSLM